MKEERRHGEALIRRDKGKERKEWRKRGKDSRKGRRYEVKEG